MEFGEYQLPKNRNEPYPRVLPVTGAKAPRNRTQHDPALHAVTHVTRSNGVAVRGAGVGSRSNKQLLLEGMVSVIVSTDHGITLAQRAQAATYGRRLSR